MKRILATVLGAVFLSFTLMIPTAQATPTPTGCSKDTGTVSCSTEDDPSNGWETETTQKGSVNSSHPEESTVTNPGGNLPPAKQ